MASGQCEKQRAVRRFQHYSRVLEPQQTQRTCVCKQARVTAQLAAEKALCSWQRAAGISFQPLVHGSWEASVFHAWAPDVLVVAV